MSLSKLTDDSLLVIFDQFSAFQQLQLREISRRLCHLIEARSLRTWKYLQYDKPVGIDWKVSPPPWNFDVIIDKCYPTKNELELRPRKSRLPLCLPRLLPCIVALTGRYHIVTEKARTENRCEGMHLNSRLEHYLRSNWSQSLVSLKVVFFNAFDNTMPSGHQWSLWRAINCLPKLTNLELFFHWRFSEEIADRIKNGQITFIPDAMPVFGQLRSFTLDKYCCTNTTLLLHQLGPHLRALTITTLDIPEAALVEWFHQNPALTELNVLLINKHGLTPQIFTSGGLNALTTLTVKLPLSDHLYELFDALASLPHLMNLQIDSINLVDLHNKARAPLHRLPPLLTVRSAAIRVNYFELSPPADDLLSVAISQLATQLSNIQILYLTGKIAENIELGLTALTADRIKEQFTQLKQLKVDFSSTNRNIKYCSSW